MGSNIRFDMSNDGMTMFNARRYDCVLSDQSLLGIDKLSINYREGGELELVFNGLSKELEGKIVTCKFQEVLHLRVTDEYFNLVGELSNLSGDQSEISTFGPVIILGDSPWITDERKILLDDGEPMPIHYVFLTEADTIDVVSRFEPTFQLRGSLGKNEGG